MGKRNGRPAEKLLWARAAFVARGCAADERRLHVPSQVFANWRQELRQIPRRHIMRTGLAILAFALLLAVPSATSAQSGTAADEKAIRDIEAQWEAAWN